MTQALFVENLYSETQFAAIIVDANEEATRHQAFRVATGRRSAQDFWSPTTANLLAWVRVDDLVSKPADTIALDRGHNLAGKVIELHKSTDNFAANNVLVFSSTVPATPDTAGVLSAANGVHTAEGAWVKSFASTSSRYWRLEIPAGGAGFTPLVVGLQLGERWEPFHFARASDAEDAVFLVEEPVSRFGWRGRGRGVRMRVGELTIKLDGTAADRDEAFRHIRDNFDLSRPMWIIFDTLLGAERAVLTLNAAGQRSGFGFRPDWGYRQATIPWVEHSPKIALE